MVLQIGRLHGSNLETTLWVSSMLSILPLRVCRRSPSHSRTSPAILRTRRPQASRASAPASSISCRNSTSPDRQAAGGVTAFARETISSQGTVSASTVATYMAINGDGFFSVQKAIGTTDNKPVFSGVTDYTRRGDFQVNANGNLVNGAGYYLMGVGVDPKTGNPLGSVPQVLQFQNNFVPAQATSSIQYAANLPTTPSTPASTTAIAGTLTAAGGLNPADFSQNPLPVGTPAVPFGDSTVTGAAALNKAATPAPITAATTLSGASPATRSLRISRPATPSWSMAPPSPSWQAAPSATSST